MTNDTAKVRVLHVRVVTGRGGGPEKTIINSPRFLSSTRYEEIACYLHPPDDPDFETIRERAAAAKCPLIGIPDRHPLSIRTLRQVAAVCRTHDIRIWHGHDYKSNLFGILLRRYLNLLLVTTVHGWVKHTQRTPLYYAIDRWTLPRHDLVIAVSSDLMDLCARVGVPSERLHLIENGIDTEEYCRRPADRAAAQGRSIVLGAAGRLSPEKGFDHAIAALGKLRAKGHDVELRIAGEGDDRARLEALIAAAGLGDQVRLMGYCHDMKAFLETIDVFCLSSLREGLPNVVLEAMAMSLPIVATRSGGMGAFGRDGSDMLLVTPGSADELASAIERLVQRPDLRSALARAARRRTEAELSFGRRMHLMKEAYDDLLMLRPDALSP